MMKRLKELEDENRRLKKMYAMEKLKADICEEVLNTLHRVVRRDYCENQLYKFARNDYRANHSRRLEFSYHSHYRTLPRH